MDNDKKLETSLEEMDTPGKKLDYLVTELGFERVEGRDPGKVLTLFGLTTCGFCNKAIDFLKGEKVSFRYAYVDKFDPIYRRIIRHYVQDTFNTSLTYPFLVIDDRKWISGFLRIEWEDMLKK